MTKFISIITGMFVVSTIHSSTNGNNQNAIFIYSKSEHMTFKDKIKKVENISDTLSYNISSVKNKTNELKKLNIELKEALKQKNENDSIKKVK